MSQGRPSRLGRWQLGPVDTCTVAPVAELPLGLTCEEPRTDANHY